MNMKVVLFLFYPEGGMYHYCVSLAKILSDFCKVYFFIPKSAIGSIQKENLTVITHDLPRIMRKSSLIKSYNVLTLLKQIYKINPNIIHFPNTNLVLGLLLPVLKMRFPIITTFHDPLLHPEDHSVKNVISRQLIIRNSDSIIVHDRYGKKVLSKHVSSKQIFNIRHVALEGVFDEFDYKSSRKKGSYVLFFGRLSEYKGLEVLAEASHQLFNKDPNIKIKIFGQGKLSSIFKNYDNVLIENRFIKDTEIPQIFLNSRFVVLPYTSASQSGIIPLAYLFGKPVLVTGVGGLPESVLEGKTGFIIPHSNPDILAEKIEYLWNLDDSSFSDFEENCKIWLEENINSQRIARETLKTYLKTIKRKKFPLKVGD